MRRHVHDRLATQFDADRIVRQLHDVPPHEVYEVVVDGRRAVYKGDTGPTGNAGLEGRVLAFVDGRTSVPVPGVLLAGDDYFVATWHPDAPAPDDSPVADETWAAAAGRELATLHAETAPAIDTYGLFVTNDCVTVSQDCDMPGDDLAIDGSDDPHAAAVDYVRRRRPVLARYGHADAADAVDDFLTNHPDALEGAGEPVCCHGWATPEHVAIGDDGVTCVVDFEHALAAPGEFDYWRTVLPTFGNNDDGREAFRDGYESVRSLPAGFDRRKPMYVLLNLVYFFESLYVQDQHGSVETIQRADRLRKQVFETLDRVSHPPRR